MTFAIRSHRRLLAGALAVAAPGSFAQAAHAGPDGPDVPTRIQVEQGNKVFMVRHATGAQIYTCNGASWGPSTPRANLYDDIGALRGTHFGGPTWQDQDGSKVVASRVDGVTLDPTAVPWLLLKKADASAGADGDRLTNTTFIQRVATTGGIAPPAADCNAITAGTKAEVPYTADYYFWKKTG